MLTYETMTFPTMLLIAIIVIALIVIIFQWVYLPKVYFETIFHSRWMSVPHHIISLFLLFITLGLAIVNYKTYQKTAEYNVQTIDNYKIRNRPFVQIKSSGITKSGKKYNPDGRLAGTEFRLYFDVKNYGQFPAFIEDIRIWIKDISGGIKDLDIPEGGENYTTENYALFQNVEELTDWTFYYGDGDIEKIKNANKPVHFVFKVTYRLLGDKEKKYYYWVEYVCHGFINNQERGTYSFLIIECGTDDIKPNI